MKSSVRILAIALALAFLLLARTAFQDSPASADEHIDLKDGEAAFADPIDPANEAKYLGFGDTATKTVVFYIDSDDLGTQITASTTDTDTSGTAHVTGPVSGVFTLAGGEQSTSTVVNIGDGTDDGEENAVAGSPGDIIGAIDLAYCLRFDTATTTIVRNPGNVNTPTGFPVPADWGLASTTTAGPAFASAAAAVTACNAVDVTANTGAATDDVVTDWTDSTISFVASSTRREKATAAKEALQADEDDWARAQNEGLYQYKSGTSWIDHSKVNPARRYTHGALPDTVGSATRPLANVNKATAVANRGTPTEGRTDLLTFITSPATNMFQSVSNATPGTDLEVQFTYDIVDVYAASDDTGPNADYKAYVSGYGRAYVSSGSDSGQWVTITEVTSVADPSGSPTSNLFRGSVVITNDTSELGGDNPPIYAQDGDTLTLQVFDENGNRSSDVLATATALIDDSPPTISDLVPADESIINDDALRISFSVNDDGAGSDFRNIEDVVRMVQVQSRTSSGDEPRSDEGTECLLTTTANDVGNAGGNASRVGVLVAPANRKFTSGGCGTVVDTGNGGKFNLIIEVQDLAGNVTKHVTQLTIDKAKPTLTDNPSVGQAWDEDKNKEKSSANSILVEFSESLDVDTVAASDFTVAGYTIDTVEVVGTNVKGGAQNLNKFVVLTLTEDLANNARPSVTVTGVSDVAGNEIEKATRTSDNKIKSELTVVPFSALIAEDGEQSISFTSDEALRSKSGANSTKGSVNGEPLTVKVADDTMGGSATFKQSVFDDSRTYGVMLQAVDIDGNVTQVGAVKVTDEPFTLDLAVDVDDSVSGRSTFSVKPKMWPLADLKLDNDYLGEVTASINGEIVASSTSAAPNWDTGTVRMRVTDGGKIEKDATIDLTYHYVTADQVIQVDVTPPTMDSEPKDNTETDNASRAIQFIWSDAGDDGKGEYAGDTYKTVTLNSAMHEGPSGTSTDILDALTTHDSKTWVYTPKADLAIGDHEFTVEATDAAGNSNEVSVTITVIERKPIKINLRVGWNLISFPSMPASTDVNDIFSSDTITVVTQYDARRVSQITAWTRSGEDGSLSSSPAGRTNIDPSLGVYVLSSDGSPLEVVTQPDDVTQVPPVINLTPGWNLVAVILIGDRTEVGVNEYLPHGEWTRAFRLNSLTGQFESFSPLTRQDDGSFTDDPKLMLGDALWVYAPEAAVIVPK